jgi:transposase-like protein
MNEVETIKCPACQSTQTHTAGLIRLEDGSLAERRRCDDCGETWLIEDASRGSSGAVLSYSRSIQRLAERLDTILVDE